MSTCLIYVSSQIMFTFLIGWNQNDNAAKDCVTAAQASSELPSYSLRNTEVPKDLLDIPISSQAYIPFNNYTSLGKAQLYDPTMLDIEDSVVSLESFEREMNISVKFRDWVRTIEEYKGFAEDCVLRDERCLIWAFEGFCNGNSFEYDGDEEKEERVDPFAVPAAVQHFMAHNCCPVCDEDTTDHLEFLSRCPQNPKSQHVFAEPGDVTTLFLRLLETVKHLSPKI